MYRGKFDSKKKGSVYLERVNDTDGYKSLFIYTHLYLQALIQVPSVTIQWNPGSFRWIPVPFHWNPVESGGMDAFLQESVGHQKVQSPNYPVRLTAYKNYTTVGVSLSGSLVVVYFGSLMRST